MALRTASGQYVSPPEKSSRFEEASGNQHDDVAFYGLEMARRFGYMLFANGGNSYNPMGFPGYDQLYTGSYPVYRWMLQHPILELVRSICVGPILASTWEYEREKDVPDNVYDHVVSNFNRLRLNLVKDYYVRGRDYGWAGGELIWKIVEGRYHLERVKPLAWEYTTVLQDKYGNMVGLENQVQIDNQTSTQLPTPYKAWKYTYDSECDYHYGRSWLENVRTTAWKDWLDAAQQLQKLSSKISGIVTVITSPAGSFPGVDKDGNQTQISYRKNAEEAIKALAEGAAGVWFPSLGLAPDSKGAIDAMKVLAELAGKSLTNIDVLNFEGQAAAIGPLIERSKHDEELMFAGGLRSARTGLEAEHGTKEEAGVHTDTGTVNAETEDEDFAKQCQPLVNAVVGLNFSPRYVDKIRIKPPSLVDRKTQVYRAIMLALMNVPEVALEFARTLDIDKLMSTLDVASQKKWSGDDAAKRYDERNNKQQDPTKATPEPQGGRPKET